LLNSGLIVATDKVAYLGGTFGKAGGTTFLEINEVNRILSAMEKYELPTFIK
jgi:hypothetical protein